MIAGVEHVRVELDRETAKVKTGPSVTFQTCLDAIKTTGKTVRLGRADGEDQRLRV